LLEREVEYADQERRPEHAAHPPEAAHRHDDQEVDEVLQRVLRIEAEEFGAEPAPSAAMPLPNAKVSVNRRAMLIPRDSAMGRLSTAARICAPTSVRSKPSQRPPAIAAPTTISTTL